MPIRDDEKFKACFVADTMDEANQLLVEYAKDIGFLASKLAMITGMDAEDLQQEGIIGLARAKRDFERERSEKFRIFAIYKIKDAMKEFITKQGNNVKTPQYVKNAAQLAEGLRKVLEKIDGHRYLSYAEIWHTSNTYEAFPPDNAKDIISDLVALRQSLKNLSDRSHTSPLQLLERAELSPTASLEIVDRDVNTISHEYNISTISENHIINTAKKILSEKEFEMFDLHFIQGETIRDMQFILGKSDGTIAVQIGDIREKLGKHKSKFVTVDK